MACSTVITAGAAKEGLDMAGWHVQQGLDKGGWQIRQGLMEDAKEHGTLLNWAILGAGAIIGFVLFWRPSGDSGSAGREQGGGATGGT